MSFSVVMPPRPLKLNNKIRLPQGLDTRATFNLEGQAQKINPELDSPEILTYWGKVNNVDAPYTKADLSSNPKHRLNNLASNQFVSLGNSLEDLDDLQHIGLKQGTLGDFMQRSGFSSAYDRTTALGERQQLITDQYNMLDNYRHDMGESIPGEIVLPKEFIVSNNSPKYAGVINYAKQQGYLDKYSNYTPPTAPTNIVLRADGDMPVGMRAFAPESDTYPIAPQSAISREPPRNIVRIPTYEEAARRSFNASSYADQLGALEQNQGKDWFNRDFTYRTGVPTLPINDPRVQTAIASSKDAKLAYQAEQQELIKQRPGSFNITVNNAGHYDRVINEGLYPGLPDDPEDWTILGLRTAKGKPYELQSNPSGQVKDITLPDSTEVMIPGIDSGWFPLTAGYNNTPTMDAFKALDAKRSAAKRAIAQYEVAKTSPSVSPEQLAGLQQIAALHSNQFALAEQNYGQAMRLEPQPIGQNIQVQLSADNADAAVKLLSSYGLSGVSLSPKEGERRLVFSGTLPLNKQMQLNSELAARYNREQVALPPNVSIASEDGIFKAANIPAGAFVKGVKWQYDPKEGHDVIVDPGKPTGEMWQQQRVTVRDDVSNPTVEAIPIVRSNVVDSEDAQEWKELLRQRDAAIAKKRALETAANKPTSSVSSLTPEEINQIVFNAVVRKQQPFAEEATVALNQALYEAQKRQSQLNMKLAQGSSPALGMDSERRYSKPQITMPRVPVKPSTVDLNTPLPELQRVPYRLGLPNYNPGSKFDLTAIAQEMGYLPQAEAAVIHPATVDLNALQAVPIPQPLKSPTPSQNFSRTRRRSNAGVNPAPTPIASADLPVSIDSLPVIIEDPAIHRGFERYVPYTAAALALGLGAGATYALTRESEEEQLRQQLAQQQMMMRMRGMR